MASSSNNIEDMMYEKFDQVFDQQFENLFIHHDDHQNAGKIRPSFNMLLCNFY